MKIKPLVVTIVTCLSGFTYLFWNATHRKELMKDVATGLVPTMGDDWWATRLKKNDVFVREFSLMPNEEVSFNISNRLDYLGLCVESASPIIDARKRDGKKYTVKLTRVVDGQFVGTYYGASLVFGDRKTEEEFLISNNTPAGVRVVVYTSQH